MKYNKISGNTGECCAKGCTKSAKIIFKEHNSIFMICHDCGIKEIQAEIDELENSKQILIKEIAELDHSKQIFMKEIDDNPPPTGEKED